MDPQSAVSALNQPWWARNPPLELAGQGVQQLVQALGGSPDTLHNAAVGAGAYRDPNRPMGQVMMDAANLAMMGAPMKYMKVRGPQASDAGYVYHATNAERAADIAQAGKLTRSRPGDYTDQDMWPDGSTEKRNYFTPTAQNTWQFAPEEGDPVLLRIKKDAHPFKRESTGDLYSTKDVPASKIEALDDGGNWLPLLGK